MVQLSLLFKAGFIGSVMYLMLPVQMSVSPEEVVNDQQTRYMVILTGSELLEGIYADTHLQYITQTLKPLGCKCVASIAVGDEWETLYDALEYATEHVDLVLTTGGLGPTDADITRQVL